MRSRAAVLLLAAACQSTAPGSVEAPADSAQGETAFELAGPNGAAILVPVTVNGEGPFEFVLDTGATMTCIAESLADSLELPALPGAVGMGAGIGSSGRLRLVRFDSLRVSGASATELPGCAVDLTQIRELGLDAHGLLGLNFLKSFRVTLDFDRSVLTLQQP